MRLKFIFALLMPVLFLAACKDTGQVGSSIQPDEDLLQVHSNNVYVKSASMLVDSALSKSSTLFLGEYADIRLGRTQVEFMTQLDARLGAGGSLKIPDTSIITTSSANTNGVLNTLLSDIDPNYGLIKRVNSPRDLKVDSVFFILRYLDSFFGDSAAIQTVNIYELSQPLEPSTNHRHYTNVDVSGYYKKSDLLGQLSYTVGNKRELKIKLDNELGESLAEIYQEGSEIKTQADFNDKFKGVYVSHSFNGGCITQISLAGIQIHYSYQGMIQTTYNGKDTTINSETLDPILNPLQSTIFLSANRSVERVNIVRHIGLTENFPLLQKEDVTYTFTPAGMYTAVNIPFETMVDSIKTKTDSISKVMFNSARLILQTQDLNWETALSTTPNRYVLLMHKDSVVPFFHQNKYPDGVSSFYAEYNSKQKSYTFDLTRAVQQKLIRQNPTSQLSEDMVVVPIIIETVDGLNYYRQQFWLTATMLHGQNAAADKRPRVDMVYTERQ